jgi:flagellar biogenesis protein FliO
MTNGHFRVELSPRFRPELRAILGFAFSLFAPEYAFAQQLGQGADYTIPVWRVAAAFLLCVTVAIAVAMVLRFRMQNARGLTFSRSSKRLKLIETLRLGTNGDICIVTCDEEEFLVAVSAGRVTLLRPLRPRHIDSETIS